MKCPKCEGSLSSLSVDGIEVDRCSSCEGIWFDRSELGTLLDRQTQRVEKILGGEDKQARNDQQGACPREGTPLLRVKSLRNRDVVLDTCPVCQGLWLDGGEFERIKAAQPAIRLGDLV